MRHFDLLGSLSNDQIRRPPGPAERRAAPILVRVSSATQLSLFSPKLEPPGRRALIAPLPSSCTSEARLIYGR